ncbi:MAG: hypothetical protein C5B49_13980 [Bdellovibrio sp.]|nr:MAG: hypothetical protein C5B49_13980 [Bdellovibrio sp.]
MTVFQWHESVIQGMAMEKSLTFKSCILTFALSLTASIQALAVKSCTDVNESDPTKGAALKNHPELYPLFDPKNKFMPYGFVQSRHRVHLKAEVPFTGPGEDMIYALDYPVHDAENARRIEAGVTIAGMIKGFYVKKILNHPADRQYSATEIFSVDWLGGSDFRIRSTESTLYTRGADDGVDVRTATGSGPSISMYYEAGGIKKYEFLRLPSDAPRGWPVRTQWISNKDTPPTLVITYDDGQIYGVNLKDMNNPKPANLNSIDLAEMPAIGIQPRGSLHQVIAPSIHQ